MSGDVYADSAERYVRQLASEIVAPHPDECLSCYLRRMIATYGCDHTLRWVQRWQRATPSSTRRLRPQLRSRGAHCDCEAVFNVFKLDIPVGPDALPPCTDLTR